MPSTASAASRGVAGPNANSASAPWIAVSCAIRRAQNPTVWSSGHQVGDGSVGSWTRNIASSRPCASRNHSTGSRSAGHSGGHGSGARCNSVEAILCSYTCATWRTRSLADQPGQVGTATSRSCSAVSASRVPSVVDLLDEGAVPHPTTLSIRVRPNSRAAIVVRPHQPFGPSGAEVSLFEVHGRPGP